MKNVLYPGQVFRFTNAPNVLHRTEWVDGVLQCLPSDLHTGSAYEDTVTQGGGKENGRRISTRFKGDLASLSWTVDRVKFTGGGVAMANDHYPDGHLVFARCGDLTLDFYQSGCFNGMVAPEDVDLLNADIFPDLPGTYETAYVAKYEVRR